MGTFCPVILQAAVPQRMDACNRWWLQVPNTKGSLGRWQKDDTQCTSTSPPSQSSDMFEGSTSPTMYYQCSHMFLKDQLVLPMFTSVLSLPVKKTMFIANIAQPASCDWRLFRDYGTHCQFSANAGCDSFDFVLLSFQWHCHSVVTVIHSAYLLCSSNLLDSRS